MATTPKQQNQCNHCGHKWFPRKDWEKSPICPKCKKGNVSLAGCGGVIIILALLVFFFFLSR